MAGVWQNEVVRNYRTWRLSLVFWIAYGLLDAINDYFMSETHGKPPLTVAQALLLCLPAWTVWGLLSPAVLALARRFRGEPVGKQVGVHAAMMVLSTVAMSGVYTFFESHWGRMHWASPFTPRHWIHNALCWTPLCLIVYFAVLGFAYAVDSARATREQALKNAELAQQLAHAQLGALRMQLQPHFFFNTLNSISMMVRAGENKCAVEMLAVLGDVLRTLLRRSPALETTLTDELAFLRRYLEIEQVRFGERLTVNWEIDEGVDEAMVPPLLLQPLIENSLRHGLDPRPDGGVLTVAARRHGDALEIEVTDDGVGLRPGFSAEESTGVGLTNTRGRLERMYGAAATLALENEPTGGVRVRCRLPYHLSAMGPRAVAA
jgi:two-component system LytT family sensor kinase